MEDFELPELETRVHVRTTVGTFQRHTSTHPYSVKLESHAKNPGNPTTAHSPKPNLAYKLTPRKDKGDKAGTV